MKSNNDVMSDVMKQSAKVNVFPILRIPTRIDRGIWSLLVLNVASVL